MIAPHILKYIEEVKRRHPDIPGHWLDACRRAPSRVQAQKLVKRWLQERDLRNVVEQQGGVRDVGLERGGLP